MYSNYGNIPNFPQSTSNSYSNFSSTAMNPQPQMTSNGDRFIGGGFLGPFVLGGITGGLLAPAFYPRPNYNNFYPYPYPYPYYGPYYR